VVFFVYHLLLFNCIMSCRIFLEFSVDLIDLFFSKEIMNVSVYEVQPKFLFD
jgi:hypothetical protein